MGLLHFAEILSNLQPLKLEIVFRGRGRVIAVLGIFIS